MKKTGLLKSLLLCSRYQKLSEPEKKAIRQNRLLDIVLWAKNNSPYYARKYSHIGESFQLEDLPPVNKLELMAHFDNWITDRFVKMDAIKEFMKNPNNIGRRFRKKYLVFTTSGSTGNPLVALSDSNTDGVMGAINVLRAFVYKEDMKAMFQRGGKSIGVFATGGFYLANSSIRARLLAAPWKKRQIAITSALLPVPQIVEQLNAFEPVMLGGYPSNLELLIEEQKSGRLRISPAIIMTGGEYLSDTLREKLSETFRCHVQTSYSCTEGGCIACECTERHFHINDDWVIIEPVDQNNNPVPDGVQSDKILLTSLFNRIQPFIRYEVTDRVVMHHEQCACGNPAPWLTLEGRTDDVVSYEENGQTVKVAPLAIYATLKEVHELKRFQLLVHDHNKTELRIDPADGTDRMEAFEKAKVKLSAFLLTQGISRAEISLSEDLPRQHEKSGKFKHIVNMMTQI